MSETYLKYALNRFLYYKLKNGSKGHLLISRFGIKDFLGERGDKSAVTLMSPFLWKHILIQMSPTLSLAASTGQSLSMHI